MFAIDGLRVSEAEAAGDNACRVPLTAQPAAHVLRNRRIMLPLASPPHLRPKQIRQAL